MVNWFTVYAEMNSSNMPEEETLFSRLWEKIPWSDSKECDQIAKLQCCYESGDTPQQFAVLVIFVKKPVAAPVPWPRGALVGLSPQTKLQALQNWNALTINKWSFG